MSCVLILSCSGVNSKLWNAAWECLWGVWRLWHLFQWPYSLLQYLLFLKCIKQILLTSVRVDTHSSPAMICNQFKMILKWGNNLFRKRVNDTANPKSSIHLEEGIWIEWGKQCFLKMVNIVEIHTNNLFKIRCQA